MSAPKFTVKNILTKNLLPGNGDAALRGKGTPLCLYVCRDDGSVWYSDLDGNMCCLSDLLLGKEVVRAFPAQGCNGRDGADSTVPGPRGATGDAGRIGVDGRPGRDAVGSVGPQGRPGRDGVDSIASPERVANLETSVRELRAERAAWLSELAALKSAHQALVDMDSNKGVYMEWLRAKAQARAEKKENK